MANALSKFENMEKIDHRYVLSYSNLKGLSPIYIKTELDSILGEFATSLTIIEYWMPEFKRGCAGFQDEHSSG